MLPPQRYQALRLQASACGRCCPSQVNWLKDLTDAIHHQLRSRVSLPCGLRCINQVRECMWFGGCELSLNVADIVNELSSQIFF